MLSKDELERYDRQIMLDGFGIEGQEKLKQAKILIAGAGGLGSVSSIYLAAAGVGTIRIIDHDVIELSNLNRQIAHWEENIGQKKVSSAADKLNKLNREVKIDAIEETLNKDNVIQLTSGFDAIIDAMDSLSVRMLLNKAAIEHNTPFFHGAVYGLEGRATTILPGKAACLRCIYPASVPPEKFPVVGVAPAVIASIQATEVIKYILGIGKLLTNRLLVYSGLNMKFSEIEFKRNPNCEHCGHLTGGGK